MIKQAIENDLPLLILGRSGWGKTALAEAAGKEMGLEVVTISLALCLPEDIGGVPQADGDSFRYLLPKWFHERIEKSFILFLDEINQAPPQVLHAIYGLVQKRELHGVSNPMMRIVAAGNLSEENPHLTEIMKPLMNRFYVHEFVHDPEPAIMYLNQKYNLNLREIQNSPRDTEQGIIAYRAGLKELALKKAGMTVINCLEGASASQADDLIRDIKIGKIKDRNGF